MKKYFLSITLILACSISFAQLSISPNTHWVNNGAVNIVLEDMSLDNDGTFVESSSRVKFTGIAGSTLGGAAALTLHETEIAKTGANKVNLVSPVTINNRVIFTSGLLDLNQQELTLTELAKLENESETSRLTGLSGGEVLITVPMNAPAASNSGNLGAIITSAMNMGSTIIRRGHRAQSGTGLPGSIQRYYTISPTNNAGLNATLRFQYFDVELNGQTENMLNMYRSNDGGLNWTNENFGSRDGNLNFVENSGINSFSRWTLSSSAAAPAPDLTSSQYFSTTQLAPGVILDEVIVIRNVSLSPTSAPIVFGITNYSPLSGLTVSMNNAPAVVIGIDNFILDNINWTFDPMIGTITSNPGVVIQPGGSRNIGIRIARGAGMQAGANGAVTQTTTIHAGTGGGDAFIMNNTISNSILKN